MISNLEHEPDWRRNYNDNKQVEVEGGMRKGRIEPKNWIGSLDSQFGTPGSDKFHRHNSLLRRVLEAHEHLFESF
jgi:hypothetical protein